MAIPEYVPGDETCPPFSWQVKLPHTGQTCTGIGNKKAEAKGQAARRMLAQIKEHGLPQNVPPQDALSLRRHPVSELQECLQKRQISHWALASLDPFLLPFCYFLMSGNLKHIVSVIPLSCLGMHTGTVKSGRTASPHLPTAVFADV